MVSRATAASRWNRPLDPYASTPNRVNEPPNYPITPLPNSRLNRGLVDEHHRNVIFDRIDALAGLTLERRAVFDQLHWCFAVGARENLEQFGIHGHAGNI